MPFRQRERFERTDVPTASPLRSIMSLVVLVIVVAGLYVLVTTLWHRANQVNGMGDRSLRASVRSQASSTGPGEGFMASDHEFATALILSAAEDGTLGQAQLLSVDRTDATGVVATVAPDTRLSVVEGTVTLASLFVDQGASACVAPLAAAANVPIGHVVVAGTDFLDQLDLLRGSELQVVLGSAADILETLTTDMSTSELLELASATQAVGISNLRFIDVPAHQEELEDGRVVSAIDQTQLGLELGMLVPVEPEPAPEEAAPEGDVAEA